MVVSLSLDQWSERLGSHFASLREQRSPTKRPLFALEHGLEGDDIKGLRTSIQDWIRFRRPHRRHALPWIVYAAEIGYGYEGDEYWQTFEQDTAGWLENGTRRWLRDQFRWFQQHFNAAEPVGVWAQHFSIICWPITHAILPRVLQEQLARYLYELRHSLTYQTLHEPAALGRLIAARALDGSSRFRQLAEEPQLLGQIATALLVAEGEGAALVLESTLRRIGKDLQRHRQAREWLKGARGRARQVIEFRGSRVGAPPSLPADPKKEAADRLKEPRLLLRPQGGRSWELSVELPSLAPLAAQSSDLRQTLLSSRARVREAAGRPIARGRLLRAPQRVRLRDIPPAGEPLLSFEPGSRALEELLSSWCLLRPAPHRLFKVAADGLARELVVPAVRPGATYVLVSSEAERVAGSVAWAEKATIADSALSACELHVPTVIDGADSEKLVAARIGVAQSVQLRPAGLCPAEWDGEGGGTWLTTEAPRVELRCDHDPGVVTLELGAESLDVPLSPAAPRRLVELDPLPAGRHKLVATSSTGSARAELELFVREPSAWTKDDGSHGGLLVVSDPSMPTLQQLWGGAASLEIFGPTGASVEITFRLRVGDATEPALTWWARRNLPIRSPDWANVVKGLRAQRDASRLYDHASKLELEIEAPGLGCCHRVAERALEPLRWSVRRRRHDYLLRLVDDFDGDAPTVERFDMGTPDRCEQLDPASLMGREPVKAREGLYVARAGDVRAGVLVSATQTDSFEGLRLACEVKPVTRNLPNAARLVFVRDLWRGAELTGAFFGGLAIKHVMAALDCEVSRLIGGEGWARAEALFDALPQGEKATGLQGLAAKLNDSSLLESIRAEVSGLTFMGAQRRADWLGARGGSRAPATRNAPLPSGGRRRVVRRRPSQRAPEASPRRLAPQAAPEATTFGLRLASGATLPRALSTEAAVAEALRPVLDDPELFRRARLIVLALPVLAGDELISWEWSE